MKRPHPTVPALYATERDADPTAHACYVHPRSGWAWFVTESDGERTFFGLVSGFEVELGYFDRLELESCGALRLEDWEPRPLSRVRSEVGA